MLRPIKIFDTTLRDGEQSPGCSMNTKEKLEVALQLEKLGVDVIEAGFAISSQGDFEAIQLISSEVKSSTICSLARAVKKDIEAAAEAIKKAQLKRIHTFIATSPIHMEFKLKMTPQEVLEQAVSSVKYAKSFVSDVEFSCEDAGRSDREFLVSVFESVIQAGATTINVPDTVGYLSPDEFGGLIAYLMQRVRGIENIVVSVHCHNDLGLATANALAGVSNGASQIECTINGIGERAGNTALEEVVMALKVRESMYQASTRIITKEIMKTSKLVSHITGSFVQPNKAIVGANAFAHESGIHQDGMLKQKRTYEIMDAEMIGLNRNELVLGKHSGRHAFSERIKEMGYVLSQEALAQAFVKFKELADSKKEILTEDLEALLFENQEKEEKIYTLKRVSVMTGNKRQPKAKVKLSKQGEIIKGEGVGAGAVDAIYKTINHLIDEEFELVDYTIQAITGGTDALGDVTVRIKEKDRIFTGRGSATDILVASTRAYLKAINKLLMARKQKRLKADL